MCNDCRNGTIEDHGFWLCPCTEPEAPHWTDSIPLIEFYETHSRIVTNYRSHGPDGPCPF